MFVANTARGQEERKHALCRAMSGRCLSVRAAVLQRGGRPADRISGRSSLPPSLQFVLEVEAN